MKLLHTSDWHVGKLLRGESRHAEHRAVLAEIVAVARAEAVDLVLVAGDSFESAAPSPEAQAIVLQALLDLHGTGAKVVVVAGNHDNAAQMEAWAPVLAEVGITMLGKAVRPDDGGVLEHITAAGERAVIAMLPFCSQRSIVRAAELMGSSAAEHRQAYAERLASVLAALTARFEATSVNVVVGHCMVRGAALGGGERDAQVTEEYWVDASAFPSAHYVALGHLHLTQQMPSGTPIWYSGSPIQVDFGEAGDAKHALVVEVTATTPARVRKVALAAGARLRTVEGTFAELAALADDVGDAFLRVFVREPVRAGLADEVRGLLPNAVEVRVIARDAPEDDVARPARHGRSPHELFAEYCATQNVEDDALLALFDRMLDDVTTAEAAP